MPQTTIELHKEAMKFSAGHFTIFSATDREPLHGHNYQVFVALTTELDAHGLTFDYRLYKKVLLELCQSLNRTFLLPTQSPHLRLESHDDYLYAYFANEKIPFLQKDITLLDLPNITVETLAAWFITQLTQNAQQLQQHAMHAIDVKVSSGPGQSGSAHWRISS